MRQTFPLAGAKVLGLLIAVPSLFAAFVMVAHGRSSDRSNERRFHFAIAVFCAASGLLIASLPVPRIVALAALVLAVSGRWSAVAPFWGLSTAFLSGTAAAGAIALINSVGNLGGFAGPYLMGWLKDTTGGFETGLRALALLMFLSGALALTIRVRKGADVSQWKALELDS
jgi:ACS family tartrate transporter-like MFS transporter